MLMIFPRRSRKCFSASRETRNGPRVLEANIASHCFRVISLELDGLVVRGVVDQDIDPAQFLYRFLDRRPHALFVGDVAAQRHRPRPKLPRSMTVCWASRTELRNVMATSAPASASPSAMARPKRRAPPVIRTVLPERGFVRSMPRIVIERSSRRERPARGSHPEHSRRSGIDPKTLRIAELLRPCSSRQTCSHLRGQNTKPLRGEVRTLPT